MFTAIFNVYLINYSFFFIVVNGQTIVSTSVIEEGGSYTVTCDASRSGVPPSVTSIVSLAIAYTSGTAPIATYARYIIISQPNNSTVRIV